MTASARRPEIGVTLRAELCLMIAALALIPLAVHAEGEDPDAGPTPKPAHHRVLKKKKPPLASPAAPIPYITLNPAAAKAAAAAPPLPPPVAIAPLPVMAPPPSPPPPPEPASPAPHGPVREINLKCDTVTSDGRKNLSRGSFYIDLFPSQVFPDQQADFKFYQVDPQHASLIRESYCLDTICDAKVTGSAYFLVDRRARKGAALRITLNRATGAFYAEEINPGGLTHGADHIGESGWCVPQKQPDVMF
jgi:hypothetical protein